jgi:DNA-directed RNA polymerase subunit beta
MQSKKISDILKKYNKTGRGRVVLTKNPVEFELPNLNSIQIESFKSFLQTDTSVADRKNEGLQFLFQSTFPFYSNDGKVRLEFDNYDIGEPKYTMDEALEKDRTYCAPVKATIRLILEETGEIKEQEIYVCDIPIMTDEGVFIINGAVRVVVSQIHRSPGVIFDYNERANMFHSRLIPERGPWLEFEIVKEVLYIRIDRKQRIPVTTLLKAVGIISNEEIIKTFYQTEVFKVSSDEDKMIDELVGRVLAKDIVFEKEEEEPQKEKEDKKPVKKTKKELAAEEAAKQDLIFSAGYRITEELVQKLVQEKVKEIELINAEDLNENEVILNTIERERVSTQDEACIYLYTVVKGTEPSNAMVARNEIIVRWKCNACEEVSDQFNQPQKCPKCGAAASEIVRVDKSIFFNGDIYSLGRVGRYKINKRFNYENADNSEVLSLRDILNTIKYLIKVKIGENPVDDIDHLGNRRIRSVGEQLMNHLKVCFARLERLARERMTIQDHDTLTPQNLISIKPITAGIKEFFGTAQLSQFMDQTNPISAVTHKRRLNALGPGGLTRERAGFEVRDIHYTHYGRMCPIETPEGPNIGLIVSLASFARINEYGFIETPYYRIEKGKVSKKVEYLSAIEEDRYNLTPYCEDLSDKGSFKDTFIPSRSKGNYPMAYPKDVQYMDVAPSQIFSISSSLIPFLEHDDANRALMGSNMMRQAVPLLNPDAPLVGTGIEEQVAAQSGFVVVSKDDGEVIYVDNERIELKVPRMKEPVVYKLKKTRRTNQDTYYNQKPIVNEGDKIKKGQVMSDGPAIDNAELAIGKNILTAFMPWEGFNYEDAILMSENLLKEDTYTSIHIEEFEIEARETKLGKETLTRDIPNISEEDYKDLDDSGIVRIGAKVKAGSILVGKVTPKGHTEITPEYKLLHSIFGEKARDVKDTSLRVPHGNEGVVISVKVYSRENRDDLKPGVIERVKVYIAKKRKLREGDKFAGRHGNKGVVARVMPAEDMPFLADGTPVDVVLNPLGVPSRMNLGQIYELVLGWVAKEMGVNFATPVFNGVSWDEITKFLKEVDLPQTGKAELYDGRTGEKFKNPVTVGYMYYLKLAHLADDKIHARSTGPYSLVTQQPLGGKAQFGGQRVGEMEVWAVEAYGAANVLQEFLTVKADAMEGRTRIYESIIKGEYVSTPGIPESFNVLVQELRGLGLRIEIYDENNNIINVAPKNKEREKKKRLI